MRTANTLPRTVGPDIAPLPTYRARDLTESGDQALFVLDDKVYTLRITRAGKLILTK